MSGSLPYVLGSGGICPECDSDNTTHNPEYGFRVCEDCCNIWGRGEDDPDYEEEPLDLGNCCACGEEAPNTRNIISLDKLASIPGTGWGCFVCNLPSDGAIAVVCDACLEAKAEIKQAIHGFAAQKERIPINALKPGVFKHTKELHEREG